MKKVNLAYLLWAQDSEKRNFPFRIPCSAGGLKDPGTNRIQIAGIGDFDPTLRSNAWLQFLFLHKDLQDPKVLLCPADKAINKERKLATSWGMEKGGLATPAKQNNSISYGIGLDAGLSQEGKPVSLELSYFHILLTERNMGYDTVNSACSANVGLTKVIKVNRQNGTNALAHVVWKGDRRPHGVGKVALLDGSVLTAFNKDLKELLLAQPDDSGELHFIYP